MTSNLRKAFLTVLLCFLLIPAMEAESIKREVRSVWIATVFNIDWPDVTGTSTSVQTKQKEQMVQILDLLKDANFNTVYFQVRSMCDAMYKSSYEPWSSFLTNKRGADPHWDPLQFVVDECHKRGMECYAWVNPLRFSSKGVVCNTEKDNFYRNKGWLLKYNDSNGSYIILNPGIAEARNQVTTVCREIVTNYDIDGLVFDDYFYPNGIPTSSAAGDYNLWKTKGNGKSIGDWRRENINKMVREVYNMVQEVKPYVKFGISPAGVASSDPSVARKHGVDPCPKGSDWQYSKIFSDPVAWIKDGSIDFISPQIYWKTDHRTNPFGPITEWWSKIARQFGCHHYASHSITFLMEGENNENGWSDIGEQIKFSRKYNTTNSPGVVLYSTQNISGKSRTGLNIWLKNNLFQKKSLTPAITWKDHRVYDKVASVGVSNSKLIWNKIENVRYAVYAIPENIHKDKILSTSGGIKSDYLLDVTYTNSFPIPSSYAKGHYFAVSILDRYGNEYAPRFSNESNKPLPKSNLLTPSKGYHFNENEPNATFSWENKESDCDFILEIAEDLQFSKILFSQDTKTVSTVVPFVKLKYNTTLYWRVRAYKIGFNESISDVWSFVAPSKPAAQKVQLVRPTNDINVTQDEFFEFSNGYADSYTLQVSSTQDFRRLFIDVELNPKEMSDGTVTTDFGMNQWGNFYYKLIHHQFPNGKYYWRVISHKTGIEDNCSDIASFNVIGSSNNAIEDNYIIKKDITFYDNANSISLTSLWMRSYVNPYANIQFPNNGLTRRSFCAIDKILYVSKRSTNSTNSACFIEKYDAYSGAYLGRLSLLENVQCSFYPCNDVMKDDKGNLLISNLTLNVSANPLKIHLIDKNTGDAKEIAACKSSSAVRIDHCSVTGDVKAGNFTVWAVGASSNIIFKWNFSNGKEKSSNEITAKAFYPKLSSHFGIAPRIFPINDTEFFINGGNIQFSRYNSDGTMTDSFKNNPSLEAEALMMNGSTYFSFLGVNYIVVPVDDWSTPTGYRFKILTTDSEMNFISMEQKWTMPTLGMGKVKSTTIDALADYEIIRDNNGRELSANIYLYVPGNGIAAYAIQKEVPSGVEAESAVNDEVKISCRNGNIVLSKAVDTVEVYNVSSMLIAEAQHTDHLTWDAPNGIYIVRCVDNGKVTVKKIVK